MTCVWSDGEESGTMLSLRPENVINGSFVVNGADLSCCGQRGIKKSDLDLVKDLKDI